MSKIQFDPALRIFSYNGAEWRYVKPLEDKNAIGRFEAKHNVSFPKDLSEILKNYNGGRPPKSLINTRGGREVVFKSLISFNKNDAVNIYDFMPFDEVKGAVPFATDPAGNIFCLYKGGIYFYDHETGETNYVADSVTEMFKMAK